jgi:hypothetical protein
VGISRDYPLKTWTSKQPIREIPGYEIIPFHPLKYPRSKQGLRELTKCHTLILLACFLHRSGYLGQWQLVFETSILVGYGLNDASPAIDESMSSFRLN